MKKRPLFEKIFLVLLVCIFSIFIIIEFKKTYFEHKIKQDEKELWAEREKIAETVVFKESYKYIDDGWYYSIYARRHEESNEYVYNYGFDGCNVKYETLDNNYGMYIDTINPENNYKIPISPPALATSYASKNNAKTEELEQRELNDLIDKKMWERKITAEDLSDTKFVNFDKDDIVELWNGMYDEEYIKDSGLYASLGSCAFKKENKNQNYYQVGVYLSFGFIKDVRIDYVDQNGKYLTDKAKSNTMTDKETKIYNNIKLIEREIVSKGSFDVIDEFKELKNDTNYKQIFSLLNELEKSRGKP